MPLQIISEVLPVAFLVLLSVVLPALILIWLLDQILIWLLHQIIPVLYLLLRRLVLFQ